MATEDYQKDLAGYSYAETQWGDSILTFAVRTLGDASRWTEIAELNNLRSPYISALGGENIAKYGEMLMIPSLDEQPSFNTDPDSVFGIDIKLNNGRFVIKNGAITTVTGVKNYVQAIANRVRTEMGELIFHQDYGCRVRDVVGIANSHTTGMLAATFVKAAIRSDVRTRAVQSCKAEMNGDKIMIDAEAVPISGRPAQSINWELS